MDRLWKALYLDDAKITVFEKIAEELARLLCNQDSVGFGKSLQAGGEVRCLAHDSALLPFARGDQIADDDLSGADTNTNPQWLGLLQSRHGVDENKAGSHPLFGGVLMRLREAEIHQDSIAH